jgi:hypothetical protein
MAMEVEHDSVDEKNNFLNRQDIAIGFIWLSISPEILHQVCDVSQDFTPNELWTRLEVLFGNKEDCEDFMQEVEQIEPKEKPSEDQTSYYEESSTKVFAQICIPLIEDNVYSISDLFSEFHVEDIWHASQGSHADTFPCAMHASQETKGKPRTSYSIMIFSEQNLQKQIGYLNSSQENIQFQKKNSPEMESKKRSYDHFKINKISAFFRKRPHDFQSFIQTLFGSSSLQEEKVDMCRHINGASTSSDPCRHLHLQQNLQRAQACTVARSSWSEGQGCLAIAFCSFSYFFYAL